MTDPRSGGTPAAAPTSPYATANPPKSELWFAARRFLGYIRDVRAGRVKRMDRDVVLSLAAEMEKHL